jgi:hypothetical protein
MSQSFALPNKSIPFLNLASAKTVLHDVSSTGSCQALDQSSHLWIVLFPDLSFKQTIELLSHKHGASAASKTVADLLFILPVDILAAREVDQLETVAVQGNVVADPKIVQND